MSRLSTLIRVVVISTLISTFATQHLWAWGGDGHRMINRLAARYLPANVPAFLRDTDALDIIEYLGPEPDRWHGKSAEELSETQAPDHFIDLERAKLAEVPCTASIPGCNPDGRMLPRQRYSFIRSLSAAQAAHPDIPLLPEKVGMQPWQVEEIWQRLEIDFREYRKLVASNQDTKPAQTVILFDVGWLGHYVGDGSQPLHTSIQYNGWTGPNPYHYSTGHYIHSQFETVYVTANIKPSDLAPLVAASKPQIIDDEWANYLTYLQHSNSLVEKVYQLDQVHGFDGAGTPQAKAFTEERLAAGAIQLRNMIDSAWVHSADSIEQQNYSRGN